MSKLPGRFLDPGRVQAGSPKQSSSGSLKTVPARPGAQGQAGSLVKPGSANCRPLSPLLANSAPPTRKSLGVRPVSPGSLEEREAAARRLGCSALTHEEFTRNHTSDSAVRGPVTSVDADDVRDAPDVSPGQSRMTSPHRERQPRNDSLQPVQSSHGSPLSLLTRSARENDGVNVEKLLLSQRSFTNPSSPLPKAREVLLESATVPAHVVIASSIQSRLDGMSPQRRQKSVGSSRVTQSPEEDDAVVKFARCQLSTAMQGEVTSALQNEVRDLRLFVDSLRAEQTSRLMMLQAEVRSLALEVSQQRNIFPKSEAQTEPTPSISTVDLREDLVSLVSDECEERLKESGQIRHHLEALSEKLADANATIRFVLEPDRLYNVLCKGGDMTRLMGNESPWSQVEAIRARNDEMFHEIGVEREQRVANFAELHAHLAREVVDLRVACVHSMEGEREAREREGTELRAIQESIWQRVDQLQHVGSQRTSTTLDDASKSQDLNTVYDMVREALGDTVRLSHEISEEREMRIQADDAMRRKVEYVESQVSTMRTTIQKVAASVLA
eukprot:CAMPEP_0194516748 /NCGR_PEP_ID=MMETSP0253-20130528/49722_1 /TAXON_ID=2966 /ORGANISM="Noctiluca scintillans" /LENGTH=556 /DNA_ID=CAMNT_0039360649 /DNA_START=45 /DNA_END=1715 /DNA_ORIENTATION=+